MTTKPTIEYPLRTVNRKPLDNWIYLNGPNGLARLSLASRVSEATISKARLGRCPRKMTTMLAICEAIGVDVDEVFPPLGRSQAV